MEFLSQEEVDALLRGVNRDVAVEPSEADNILIYCKGYSDGIKDGLSAITERIGNLLEEYTIVKK